MSGDLGQLPGIGPKRILLLERLGIHTLEDLILHFPRDYQDRSRPADIESLVPCPFVCIRAKLKEAPQARIRRRLTVVTATVFDDSGAVDVVWYNQPYLEKALRPGEYVFCGAVGEFNGRLILESPEYEAVTAKMPPIVPIYPLTAGLSQKMLRKFLQDALATGAVSADDGLPADVCEAHGLMPRRDALVNIHFPENAEAFYAARRTLVFTELFNLQLKLLKTRGLLQKTPGHAFADTDTAPFKSALPFSFTDAQDRVLTDILADMSGGHVMNRLLQGDVGSGKTAVAMAAMYVAAKNGGQSAYMAPTETLARQQYAGICRIFDAFDINVALLTGSMAKNDKNILKDKLARGDIDIVVGTHALIVADVAFDRLRLVICDEQHRFGVRQRGALAEKGHHPHYLVMTATPIPRSLALILYGDMDMSIIDELPPGRLSIHTNAVGSSYRDRIYAFIKKHVDLGRQAFIVCPVIEESDSGLSAVKTYAQRASEAIGLKVAVMHGKLPQSEKNAVMAAFAANEYPVLISTTLIEVGIDVPNAAVMLIENAERFGLAQLHQLRGRVGRGPHQSYCVLITDSVSALTKERMKAITATNDGFALAESDLRLRGPGDFFGTRQHGLPPLTIANLYRDGDILKEAQAAARGYWALVLT